MAEIGMGCAKHRRQHAKVTHSRLCADRPSSQGLFEFTDPTFDHSGRTGTGKPPTMEES